MEKSTVRQIRDIQQQADALLTGPANEQALLEFAKYHTELKTFLAESLEPGFALDHVSTIPDFHPENISNSGKKAAGLIGLVIGGLWGGALVKHSQLQNALNEIREIQGKYASLEFLMRND